MQKLGTPQRGRKHDAPQSLEEPDSCRNQEPRRGDENCDHCSSSSSFLFSRNQEPRRGDENFVVMIVRVTIGTVEIRNPVEGTKTQMSTTRVPFTTVEIRNPVEGTKTMRQHSNNQFAWQKLGTPQRGRKLEWFRSSGCLFLVEIKNPVKGAKTFLHI